MYIAPNNQTSLNLAEKFIAAAPDAAAKFFEGLATHEALQFIAPLKAEYITACLEAMTPERAAPILRRLPLKQAAHITESFNINFAAKILAILPPHHKSKIEAALPASIVAELTSALNYPLGSVGAVMRSGAFTFKTDVKAEEIITKFKNMPRKKVPYQIYILDKSGRLAGIIRLADMLFSAPSAQAGSIMQTDAIKVLPLENIKNAEKLMQDNALLELPVANDKNILLGVFYGAQAQPKVKTTNAKNIFSIFKK